LDIITVKKKRKYVLRYISEYNKILKTINVEIGDSKDRDYLFELVKRDFRSRFKDTDLTEMEELRLNGYILAKWREYV
jgi:hypothetical protein